MAGWFDKVKDSLSTERGETFSEDYVEVEPAKETAGSKVVVRPFTLEKFEDVKPILNAIREGRTIALINITPIKEQDKTELKRSVDKLKKTVKANEGDIAGIGECWLIATPSFAKIFRKKAEMKEEESEKEE